MIRDPASLPMSESYRFHVEHRWNIGFTWNQQPCRLTFDYLCKRPISGHSLVCRSTDRIQRKARHLTADRLVIES